LNENNSFVHTFQTASEKSKNGKIAEVKIILHANIIPTGADKRTYNLPTADELAVIIPTSNNDITHHNKNRDIEISTKNGKLQRTMKLIQCTIHYNTYCFIHMEIWDGTQK